MNISDHKFWIGIASAFVLPTLAYVYTQGRTAQSIEQLAESMSKFQTGIDATNDRLNNIGETSRLNNSKIEVMERHFERIDQVIENHGGRIVALETKSGFGGR